MGRPISEKVVTELVGPPRRHYFGGSKLSDQIAPAGFGVDVQPTGAKSFFLHYRRDGRPYWHTLGKWNGSPKGGSLSVAAAIRTARARAEELAKPSTDPRPPRTRRIDLGGAADGKQMVADVLAAYVQRMRKDRGSNFRTLDSVERALKRCVVPRIGKLAATELKRKHVVETLDAIADENGPIMADRVLAYFKTAWTWANDRDEQIPMPFTRGMRRTRAADSIRTRVPNDAEIAAIWNATDDGAPYSRLIRFVLLTGARRSEAAELPWSEIDIGKGLWLLPAARHKAKTAVTRPLSKLALKQLVPDGEPLAFNFSNGVLTRALRRLWKTSGTDDWQLHDLRRACRTLLARAGISTEVSERALGHSRPFLGQTYDQHNYDRELKDAYERLATLVEQIADPQPNVPPLRAR
jgi:integrase